MTHARQGQEHEDPAFHEDSGESDAVVDVALALGAHDLVGEVGIEAHARTVNMSASPRVRIGSKGQEHLRQTDREISAETKEDAREPRHGGRGRDEIELDIWVAVSGSRPTTMSTLSKLTIITGSPLGHICAIALQVNRLLARAIVAGLGEDEGLQTVSGFGNEGARRLRTLTAMM